jgi:hypothetical protein
MQLPSNRASVEQQASAIESKRSLLAYLRSEPQRLTIESYLCLTCILSMAGWRYDQESWMKGEHRLPTLKAAALELEHQIGADRDRLLQKTVRNYPQVPPQNAPLSSATEERRQHSSSSSSSRTA